MIKRIISGFLIMLVLIGTIGVSYDAHYCCGKFIKSQVSFIPKTLSCGMQMAASGTDDGSDAISHKCCTNKHASFELTDDVDVDQTSVTAFPSVFTVPTTVTTAYIVDLENEYSFIGYSPPPITEDLVILNQSFLI